MNFVDDIARDVVGLVEPADYSGGVPRRPTERRKSQTAARFSCSSLREGDGPRNLRRAQSVAGQFKRRWLISSGLCLHLGHSLLFSGFIRAR